MDDFEWPSCTLQDDAVFDQISKWGNACFGPIVNQDDDSYCDEQRNGKVGSASKNHSEAEKRRRDRINAHLATLRKLVSNSDKMDKATLLGKVVEHLKELKSSTTELSKAFSVPTDSDEVNIDVVSSSIEPSDNVFINVSFCCEDRPELLSEINQTLKSLRLTMVQADMTCLGGRIKCSFILCVINNNNNNEMATLKQTLKILFGRIVSSSSSSTSNYRIKSKRQRFFCSSDYNTKGYQ
ncbi:hypothetical protein R6Q57_013364 [Mikania cordata]